MLVKKNKTLLAQHLKHRTDVGLTMVLKLFNKQLLVKEVVLWVLFYFLFFVFGVLLS